jgi:farnesyl diphosphate synthase
MTLCDDDGRLMRIMLMKKVTLQTELGQLIDLITAPEDDVDLSKFSLEK